MIKKELLSSRQLISLIMLFLFGSNVVIGVNITSDVEQDAWIALIFSFLFNIPYIIILSKIISLFPKKNIYEICDQLFGKKIGTFLNIVFLCHTLHLGSIVLRNFSEYIEITTLSETPQLPIMVSLIAMVIYLAKSGIKTFGRWSLIIITVILSTLAFTIIFSISIFEFDYIKPILEHNLKQMSNSAFKLFMLPFSEIVIFLGLADSVSIKNREKKTFILSILFGGIALLSIIVRNILVLGIPLLEASSFSSYQAARIIQIGEFITRIEGLITINFVLAGITKITIFVIVLSKGIAHLSKNNDYRKLIIPSSLIILSLCPFLFDNVIDMFDFAKIFSLYAIPVQVILPLLIFITALIKKH